MNAKLEQLANYLRQAHYPAYMELVKLAFVNEQYQTLYNSTVFQSLFERLDADSQEWMDEFMDLNSMIFVEYPVVKVLGSGGYGTAYELEDQRVMKIFSDTDILDYYNGVMEKLHSGEEKSSAVMVYDADLFRTPKDSRGKESAFEEGRTLGYAIMERLDVPTEDDKRYKVLMAVSSAVFDYDYTKGGLAGADPEQVRSFVMQRVIREFVDQELYQVELDKAGLTQDDVDAYINLILERIGMNPDENDYGPENMGYRENTNQPVAFDYFMGGGSSEENKEKYLKKMDWQYSDE